jgi:TolB-like protein/Tfp pilus assembly protein PilF
VDDDLKRRIDASREAGYADELKRIDREIDSRAQELLRQTLDREEAVRQEKLKSLEADQLRARQAIVAREEEFRQKLQDSQREKQERLKRAREERRLREEAEQRRREEEERLRAEEDRRRKEEEEARQKAEEERRRQEEEIRRQAEEERRKEEERLRREEELRKKEEEERRKLQEEIRRKEGELRRQEEERRERIITLIASAEVLFANNDYENARVEVAKALVNDPENPEARALERKIKEAQGISVTEQTPEPEPEYVPAPVPEDLRTINTISPAGAIKGEAKPRGKKWFIIAAVVVIAGLVVLWQVQKGLFPSSFKVAVLPFSSSANSIEEARLGSSLAMEVINRFEHVEALEVMAYPSAVNLQSGSRPPEQEAYRLGFLYALRGSVRQNSGGIEVQVTLEDSSGMKAWSKTYPVSTRELSGFASLLVHDVLEVMEIDASTIERVTRQHSATPAPGLYAFYLGGLEQLGRPGAGGAEAAYSFFMQALSEESTYAQAAAGASLALLTSMDPQFQIPESSMQKAESLAKTALTYDPLNPEAHLALARLLLMKKKYELAGSQLDTVSQETPNNADAFLLRARIRTELGEYRKAFDDAVRAYSLNPRDMDVLTTLANIHLLLGSIREGFGYIESVVAIAPDSTEFLIGPYANAILFEPELLLTHSGRVRRACERRLLANPQDYRALYRLARMMQVSGSALEGSALFERNVRLIQAALKSDPGDPEKTMYLALTLTRLGRYPEASNLTRRMVEQWGKSAFVQYKAAQVSALQMYSQKKKETDPKKQEEVLAFLKTAMRQRFMLQEIVDGDFYNVFDKKEFRSAIRAVVE